MASVAAVAADIARPPIENDLGEGTGAPGEITSAILPADAPLPGVNGAKEDEDDDIQRTARSRGRGEAEVNGDVGLVEEVNGQGLDDLFGDEEEEFPDNPADAMRPKRRQLEDEEIDSGDEGRVDRVEDMSEGQQENIAHEKNVMDIEIARQAAPQPSDGEMYLLKVPRFLAVEPKTWSHLSFQPPITDHHSKTTPSSTFSAYNTALSTLRWRRSPNDPGELQSSARILRWSDGSLTLQLASDPSTQYEIDANALAPPQRNPIKPTPTSARPDKRSAARNQASAKYDQSRDSFTYLVAPCEEAQVLRVAHKVTAGLKVIATKDRTDDALERLQANLAAAAGAKAVGGAGIVIENINEDPEMGRKRAEVAFKEKERAAKKEEAARERAENGGTGRRGGMGASRYGAGGGLTAGLLEDDELAGAAPRGRQAGRPRKRPQRRNSEYSDDEDFGRRGFASKQDEYDREDDFLADSEEEEIVEDYEDEDDGIVEAPRERTPKRDRPRLDAKESAAGDNAEADVAARSKRRRIVDDDEDEE